MSFRPVVGCGVVLIVLGRAGSAAAHTGGTLYLNLKVAGEKVELRLQGTVKEFAKAAGMGPKDMPPTSLILERKKLILSNVKKALTLKADKGADCAVTRENLEVVSKTVITTFDYKCPQKKLRFRSDFLFDTDPTLQTFVTLRIGGNAQMHVFKKGQKREIVFDPAVSLWKQCQEFFILGMHHIFGGYDHLLFLLALILAVPTRGQGAQPATTRKGAPVSGGSRPIVDLLKTITAFTVAHTITLILAALEVINIPAHVVEPLIAASIMYVAIENWIAPQSRHRWWFVFIFGLIHGFGFAQILRDGGLPGQGLLLALISFNVGVEVGQILSILLLAPLVIRLAGKPPGVLVGISLLALLALFFGALAVSGVSLDSLSYWTPICLGLLLLGIFLVRRFGYDNIMLRGGSGVVALFGLLWLIQRVAGIELLGGLLG